ncbi:hypothetical protein ACIBQX_41070 [Nonomuraea sp. NPDC049714]|uniref:hypothetical protein n=1 Tax=Nonomuraea sp. NPDC049714 TaxID=3364357 RepID=UPI003796E6F6
MNHGVESQTVRLLATRLPSWTVWYGHHTGHFWALLKRRPGVHELHVEAGTAAELESRASEAERRLLGATDAPPSLRDVAPLEGVLADS